MAQAFRACGAEIVAYDRHAPTCGGCFASLSKCTCQTVLHPPGFGLYCPWRAQLADKSIDAIIAVATPEVTTEVALACAAAGRAVCASKPLFDHPETIRAPFYVDFWRLDAPDYRVFFEQLWKHPDRLVRIALHGNGPVRSFPGVFDYGPHVLAALIHAAGGGSIQYEQVRRSEFNGGETLTAFGTASRHMKFRLDFGNGSEVPVRELWLGDQRFALEDGIAIGNCTKAFALERFCAHFLADVSEGTADPKWLRLSRRADEEIRKIREMAVSA